MSGLTAAFFLGQFASPFYSLPLAERVSLGGAFVISGYGLAGLGGFFVVLALVNRRRSVRQPDSGRTSGAAGGA